MSLTFFHHSAFALQTNAWLPKAGAPLICCQVFSVYILATGTIHSLAKWCDGITFPFLEKFLFFLKFLLVVFVVFLVLYAFATKSQPQIH